MLNKDVVSIRIVTTPEKIVVKEAKRSFSYLHLFDYNVDAIVINKIFPNESLTGYFQSWVKLQKESIQDINESFEGIPIFQVELMNHELRKYEILKQVADQIYGETRPEDVLFRDKIFTVNKDEKGYYLSINIPFVDKRQLNLTQKGDEITIAIKNEKRSFVLPTKLQSKEITGAKYNENKLDIHFM